MRVDAVDNNASIRRYHEVLARRHDEEMASRRKEQIRQTEQRQEEERVQAARRLGLDKGQHVDISV